MDKAKKRFSDVQAFVPRDRTNMDQVLNFPKHNVVVTVSFSTLDKVNKFQDMNNPNKFDDKYDSNYLNDIMKASCVEEVPGKSDADGPNKD